MSQWYLQKTTTAQVDPNTLVAVASLGPDVGQFWTPSLITVSTQTTPQNNFDDAFNGFNNVSSPQCTLYRGQATNDPSSQQYVDDTFSGSNDATTILAGTVIQYGESISARWYQAQPRDNCVLTVYGRSANSLVELQEVLSPVPGTRFAGNSGSGMVWHYEDDRRAAPVFPFGTQFSSSSGDPIGSSPRIFPMGELVSATVTLTTTAAAGNRTVGLQGVALDVFNNVQVPVFQVWAVTAQGVSSTATYHFAPGIQGQSFGVTPNIHFQIPIPPNINLADLTISPQNTIGLQAGDTWTNWTVIYRRYNTLAKVSIT
jgi:hypothetical protein